MTGNKVNKKILRKFGYKADQQGIINRYLREMGKWDNHLHKCRKYILDSLQYHKPDVVTFLGSGWLLDIPLEEVEEKCRTINLVDLMHPSQVRYKVSGLNKVKLYEHDLTGGALEGIRKACRKKLDINDIYIPIYEPGFETGLVFSVNVLTQLDSLPADFLLHKTKMEHREIDKLRKALQAAHIRYLKNIDSILITDYIEYLKAGDKMTGHNDLVYTPLPDGRRTEEWTWEFDSSGKYYKGKNVIFGVKAIDLVKE